MKLFQSRQAVGQAFQGAMRPDGTVDPAAAAQAISDNPAAAPDAAEAYGTLLQQRGAQLDNSSKSLALGVANNGAAASIFAAYAQKPNLTPIDIDSMVTQMTTVGVDPATAAAYATKARSAYASGGSKGLRDVIGDTATLAMGAAAAAQPTPGPPAPGTMAPTAIPLASRSYPGSAPGVGGGAAPMVTGPGPAQTTAMTAAGTAYGQQAGNIGIAAQGSPIRKGMLQNLEADMHNFTPGAASDWTNVAKNFANRNILPQSMQFDPTSISSQEQFQKQAEQLAQQQFQALGGTGTDQMFGSSFKANPNVTLSKLGNQGIVGLLKGNEDAIQAMNTAWQKWQAAGNGPETSQQFIQQWNSTFDPRVYQAQYMGQKDYTDLVKSMSAADQRKFLANKAAAKQDGYVVGPGGYYSGQ
jgi:hypothetical protein